MYTRLKIDHRTKAAKSFLQYAKSLPFVSFEEENELNVDNQHFRPKNSKFRPLPKSNNALIPHIKSEKVYAVFQILKDYFHPEKHPELKTLLETGQNLSGHKLLFLDNVNRLADTFKKLFEHDFISSCKKQDLQAWMVANFQYLFRNNVADISETTIERYISSVNDEIHCKRPLITIVNKQIIKL